MKVGCLEALQFHLLFKLAGEASRRWVRPLCVVCGGPLTSWCRQRPRCLQAVGRPPQPPCPEHLPTPHDFISPLTPLLPLWTCVPKRGGSPRLLTNGYLLFNPTGLVDPKVVSQRPLSLAEGMTLQSWEN